MKEPIASENPEYARDVIIEMLANSFDVSTAVIRKRLEAERIQLT